MSIEDGGPAFPAPDLGEQEFGQRGAYPGMTLRDYFAAKAMQALISSDEWRIDCDYEITAGSAYRAADYMLKARKETK
jgi:hypothetical protein